VVLAVDVSHPPPAYSIRLDGTDTTRETEGHRLHLRAPDPQPPQAAVPANPMAAGLLHASPTFYHTAVGLSPL
jgi:hypothetical protein